MIQMSSLSNLDNALNKLQQLDNNINYDDASPPLFQRNPSSSSFLMSTNPIPI